MFHLIRVTRGAYRLHPKLLESLPTLEDVIAVIEKQAGHQLVLHGAAEAWRLDLADERPKRDVFLWAGRNRKPFGECMRLVDIISGPKWQLALGKTRAGGALRALAWMGKGRTREALVKLKRTLPDAEWLAIVSQRAVVPGWLAQEISEAHTRGQ